MKKIFQAFIVMMIFFNVPKAFALDLKNSSLEFGFGYPTQLTITNPDDTIAYYNGFGFDGKLSIPLTEGKPKSNIGDGLENLSLSILLGYKGLQLKNANSGSIEESSKHRGYTLGLSLRLGPIYIGSSYGLLTAKHETTGSLSNTTSYKYTPIISEIGFLIPHGNIMDIGLTYGFTQSKLKTDETNLSKDLDYKEEMIWLKVIFYFQNR